MAVYYVDATGGDDDRDGQSESQAWQTLEKVHDEFGNGTFQGGDRILFKRGETWPATNGGRLRVRNVAGTSEENPLYIGYYGSGARPLIDGENNIWTYILGTGFDDPAVNHVVVEGLSIRGSMAQCVYLSGTAHWWFLDYEQDGSMLIRETSSYIHILQCDFTSSNAGDPKSTIYIGNGDYPGDFSHHVWIQDSHIHDIAGIGAFGPWALEGIDVKSEAHHVYIERNIIENADVGITLRGDDHVVRDNVITNPDGDAGIAGWEGPASWGDYGKRWTIQGNLIKNCQYGLHLEGEDHVIRNNTIVNCSADAVWLSSTANVTLRNNIYYNLGGYGLYSYTEIPDSDYNRYPPLAANQLYLVTGGGQRNIADACDAHGIECNSTTGDPLFIDEVDYEIIEDVTSSCYQAGDDGSNIGYYQGGEPTITRVATWKRAEQGKAVLIEFGVKMVIEIDHADLTVFDTEEKLKAEAERQAKRKLPTIIFHINHDGSVAVAVGEEPDVWPEDE